MSTKREQIIAAIKVKLSDIPSLPVYRSRVEPFTRNRVPALVIEPVRDIPDNSVVPMIDWSLIVKATLLVRGDIPDQIADTYIKSIHEKIMQDQSLDGLAMDVQPGPVEYEILEGDKPVGVVNMNFVVSYRTTSKNLES